MTDQPRNRIIDYREVRAGDLVPFAVDGMVNWRVHSERQRAAMRRELGITGHVGAVLTFEYEGQLMLIDGHMRQDLDPEARLPVLVTDLTPEEAKHVLATFDPLGGLAETDAVALGALVAGDDAFDRAAFQELDAVINEGQAVLDTLAGQLAGGGGSSTDGMGHLPPHVKVVVLVPDLEVVEAALYATGLTNRGEALVTICKAYLERHAKR